MAASIFDRCGGFASVHRVVSAFYDKVLDSDRLADHFVDVSMPDLIDHQAKFVAQVMGGPVLFSDDHLRTVHAHLGINQAEFREAAALLREAFEDFDIDPADIARIMQEIGNREALIVTRR